MKYPTTVQKFQAQTPSEIPPGQIRRAAWLAPILRDRIVQIGISAWILFSIAIPFLARGTIPFDQPDLARVPYVWRVWGEVTGPIFALVLIGVIFALTHSRSVDVGARAPEKAIARRETFAVLVYGVVVLIGGQLVGRALGMHGLGLHLSGSMFGL